MLATDLLAIDPAAFSRLASEAKAAVERAEDDLAAARAGSGLAREAGTIGTRPLASASLGELAGSGEDDAGDVAVVRGRDVPDDHRGAVWERDLAADVRGAIEADDEAGAPPAGVDNG